MAPMWLPRCLRPVGWIPGEITMGAAACCGGACPAARQQRALCLGLAVADRLARVVSLPQVGGEDAGLDAADVGGDADRHLDDVVGDRQVHQPLLGAAAATAAAAL